VFNSVSKPLKKRLLSLAFSGSIMRRFSRAASRGLKAGSMTAPLIGLIMGSQSDWATLRVASEVLDALSIPHETRIVSAHRTPERLYAYAKGAAARGLKAIIAGAGGAAHLPGMAASMTILPVLGVPIESKVLKGMDSLLSIVQMPGGVPVATFAIGESGAKNAALHAAAILALSDSALADRLETWRKKQTDSVSETPSDAAQ
jgi:5-(carboxyamino)imidazole ribonucleotide mutase